ncbi:hypothetical protein [Paenibacillus sp. GCM10027626]|uniref:hypothetical protein n=1 Tax=Paenibacillus sp. GCM10027626 TaxID=3273411 RepID=UPI003639C6DB
MKHPTSATWHDYVQDRLTTQECEQIEQHLAVCDLCMERYMKGASELQPLERLSAEQSGRLTDAVMSKVAALPPYAVKQQKRRRKKPVRRAVQRQSGSRRQMMVHYVIAVCFMLLLMSAGVFEHLAALTDQWRTEQYGRQHEDGRQRIRVTDTIMEKTTSVIGAMLDKPTTDARKNGVN